MTGPSLKLAVLSHCLPPSTAGQAIILHRLLRGIPPEDYCLLSRQDLDAVACEENWITRLPARHYRLAPDSGQRGTDQPRVLAVGSALWQVVRRASHILDVIRRERCDAIIACSGDPVDLPAAFVANQWARIPLYAYMFDDYVYQWTGDLARSMAQIVERVMLRRNGVHVIVPNEFLRDEYRRRYRVEPTVIHNPCEDGNTAGADETAWPTDHGQIRIVYTGAIYHAHYDSFERLVTAVQQLHSPEVKLWLYSTQSAPELERHGICGPVVHNGHLAPQDVPAIQRRADILFLPLAFDSPIREVIRTSSPGKMGEYLASGRPILVHAPADTYLCSYFRQHQCGIVVDRDDPEALVEGIRHIAKDARLRRSIVENAQLRARADFAPDVARAKLLQLLHGHAG